MRRSTVIALLAAAISFQVQAQVTPLVTVHSDEKPAYVSPFDKKEPTPTSQTLRLPGYVALQEPAAKSDPLPAARPILRQVHPSTFRVTRPKAVVHPQPAMVKTIVAETHPSTAPANNTNSSAPVALLVASTPVAVASQPYVSAPVERQNAQGTHDAPHLQPAIVTSLQPSSPLPIAQNPRLTQPGTDVFPEVTPVQMVNRDAPHVAAPVQQTRVVPAEVTPIVETSAWTALTHKMLEPWSATYALIGLALASLCVAWFSLSGKIAKMWVDRDPALHDPWFSK